MKTTEQLRDGLTRKAVHAAGMVRRMAITLTSRALWQLTGFTLLDGSRETMAAEPFLGLGIAARPSSSGKPEAIVLMIGDDAKTPVVVAVRDEATRQAIAGALAADETALYNSKVIAIAKADGTFEVRSKAGVAVALATKADLDALATWIHTAMIVNATGATAGTTTPPPSATGTTKLRGE